MGFLAVFDATKQESLSVALGICERLLERRGGGGGAGELPAIYLVGNKTDEGPLHDEFRKIVGAAKAFAARNKISFVEVSAVEFTRVRKLFRDVVEELACAGLDLSKAAVDSPVLDTETSGAEQGFGWGLGALALRGFGW